MEVDFLIQDMFTAVRPQWKLITDLDDAAKAFSDAVQVKYKQEASGRPAEEAEDAESSDSDVALEDEENAAEVDKHDSSGEEGEEDVDEQSDVEKDEHDSSEEEHIVVVREEERIDPEAEAEFDREFAAMMAESLDSRKTDRQTRFDLPLPARRVQRPTMERETIAEGSDSGNEAPPPPVTNTMAFQLMTKKGNRNQVIILGKVLFATTADTSLDSHY